MAVEPTPEINDPGDPGGLPESISVKIDLPIDDALLEPIIVRLLDAMKTNTQLYLEPNWDEIYVCLQFQPGLSALNYRLELLLADLLNSWPYDDVEDEEREGFRDGLVKIRKIIDDFLATKGPLP